MRKKAVAALIGALVLALVCVPSGAQALDGDASILARLIWTEARGVDSVEEQAAVAWCVLNRVDDPRWPDTIAAVAKQTHQFAYRGSAPVTHELYTLAQDVLMRWKLEKLGAGDAGRVLPKEYVFFAGWSGRNWFRKTEKGGVYWDWSLENPYQKEE